MSGSTKTEEDIRKVSAAMDMLAKLIIQKQQDGTQLKIEYQHKLKELNNLINLLLNINTQISEKNPEMVEYNVNETELDRILRNGINIEERNGQEYALIPVKRQGRIEQVLTDSAAVTAKKKKKKKNKISCSYCHEQGHTRAHCQKKLLNPIP